MLQTRPINNAREVIQYSVETRRYVKNPFEWPNSAYGLVFPDTDDLTDWGTGTLIGPNIVLTAGHVVYKKKDNTQRMQFWSVAHHQVKVQHCFAVEKDHEDYAILILEKPIGEKLGYFGLSCLSVEELKKKRIHLKGYPIDKADPTSKYYELWEMDGEASFNKKCNAIEYTFRTESGQSGGGVYYQEGDDCYICGIHRSTTALAVRRATFLTKFIYEQISKWLLEIKSNGDFLVETEKPKESKETNETENASENDIFGSGIGSKYDLNSLSNS